MLARFQSDHHQMKFSCALDGAWLDQVHNTYLPSMLTRPFSNVSRQKVSNSGSYY